jgi:putative DNA primase/helicase
MTTNNRRSRKATQPAAARDAELSWLAGMLEELVDAPASARQSFGSVSADWFTLPEARRVLNAIGRVIDLPAPKLADVTAAIRTNDSDGTGDQPAIALFSEIVARTSASPQAYRLGMARYLAEIEVAYQHSTLAEITATVASKAASGTIDESDVDQIEEAAARVRDVLHRRGQRRDRLVLVRASEIEVTTINWLWPQRIVGDGLTIITGPVGISKSLISVDVAARVTTAGKWPDGTGHAPMGSVILFGAEDDAGKVVVPRLIAAGADLTRVHVCQGATTGRDDDEPAAVVLERHIGQLRAALDEVSDCRLIVFDPLPDYIAADENSSAEVRSALVPLARLAQEKKVAVVAVLHQNKKNDLTTVQRIAGSGAFAQIARVVLAIGTHPDDAGKETGKRRVMLVSKNNYGERDVGQAYEIETRSNDQPGLCWLPGAVTMDADELARRPTGGREHEDRRAEAVDALREMLALGERNAGATTEELQDRGFGRRQIDYAAATLNVIKHKARDGWYWRLPAREPGQGAKPEPEPAFAAWAPNEVEQFNRT